MHRTPSLAPALSRRFHFLPRLFVAPIAGTLLILACLAHAHAGSEPPIGRNAAAGKSADETSAANLQALQSRAGKSGQLLVDTLRKTFPGYRLIEACEGSFKREGARDFLLGLSDAGAKSAVYVVFTRERDGRYVSAKLLEFPLAEGKGTAVECMSWTEARRIRADYAGRHYISAPGEPAFTDFGLRSQFDLACVVPPGDREYLCYGYDFKKQKFDMAAGWSNEATEP